MYSLVVTDVQNQGGENLPPLLFSLPNQLTLFIILTINIIIINFYLFKIKLLSRIYI